MLQRWMLAVTVGAVLVSAGGCVRVQDNGKNAAPPLVAVARPPIADLPVPKGFRLDPKSRTIAQVGIRLAEHHYRGLADKFALSRFYKRHMPISRWKLVTEALVDNKITLEFEKERERCWLTIVQGGVITPSRVTALLWPDGRRDGNPRK